MAKRIVITLFLVGSFFTAGTSHADSRGVRVEVLKTKAKNRLEKRKKGFDRYLKKLEKLEKRRLAEAYKMKAIRKALARKKEKARKSFVRTTKSFPKQAYRKFLAKRDQRKGLLENAREDYVSVQNELKKIFKNKKYRIDGNKEFDL